MKKILCALLALIFLLLCGCAGDAPGTEPSFTPGETVNLTDLAGGALTQEELTACIEQAKQAAEQVPEYTGEPLIPADPDRQVYIAIGEQDFDYYPDTGLGGCSVFVLTREAYSANQIRVRIPAKTAYTVTVNELTEYCMKTYGEGVAGNLCMNSYHYLCLQDMDWRWLAQEGKNVDAAGTLFGSKITEKEYQAYEYMREAYNQLLESYQAQYDAFPEEELPQFHVYDVSIFFTGIGSHDETVETVEFIFGDEVYPVDIGQWRLHRQLPEELKEAEGLSQSMMIVTALAGSPYEGEIAQLLDALSFTANEDLTVTGVRQLTDSVDILGGRVVISDSQGGSSDFYWDLQRPLKIAAGSQVSIHLYVKDAFFAQFLAMKSAYLVMDYEVDGEPQGMFLPCMLWRGGNIWDYYLMAFEGYDLGEYFTCYLPNPTEGWLKNLPEEWLQ